MLPASASLFERRGTGIFIAINPKPLQNPFYMSKYLFLALFFLIGPCLLAQAPFTELLDNYYRNYFPEKVFVHTDKSVYAGGETILAAVYLVDGRYHLPDSVSKTIYLELHNAQGETVSRKQIYAFDGHTSGSISLPANILPGYYQLTAYTSYQRNSGVNTLFRKAIEIVGGLKESGGIAAPAEDIVPLNEAPASDDNVSLRFFAEGGDCITGIPCRVAFVAETANGEPLAVEASLLGEEGKIEDSVFTETTGIGTFTYTPVAGESYRVLPEGTSKAFELPEALDSGIHLGVEVATDTVTLQLATNTETGLEGATLLLHLRGVHLFEQAIPEESTELSILLPVPALPAGVIVATVFDGGGQPVAERLFFVPPARSELFVQPSAERYDFRTAAKIQLAAPYRDAAADSLAESRISLSILPQASTGGPKGDDIRTWLLLNSDIDRPVQHAPELLFAGEEAERARRTDEFLLTRAWRRFRWPDLGLLDDFKPDYLLEPGLYLRGRMTKLENENAARPGKLFLTRMENGFTAQTMSDEEGYFAFGPIIVFDTFPVMVQGRFKFGKKNRNNPDIDLEDNSNVNLKRVELDPVMLPPLTAMDVRSPAIKEEELEEEEDDYAEISRKALTVARTYDSLIIDLDVVDITAARIDQEEEVRQERSKLYGGQPDTRILVADNPRIRTAVNILDLLRGLPGVQLTKNADNEDIVVIRGNSGIDGPVEPLYFLDGVETRFERLVNMPIRIIEFIDVVKGPRAVGLGAPPTGGAIVAYTYQDERGRLKEAGLLETEFQGYQKVREFATFDASLPENRNRPDLRTTLHWVADLRTNERGRVDVDFVTSDQRGLFTVIAQGLRKDGTPFFGSCEFRVGEE